MSVCKDCKNYDGFGSSDSLVVLACTINSEDKHHSFDDKPAIEYINGDKYWCQHGLLHRLDGAAYIQARGFFSYWYNGDEVDHTTSKKIIVGKSIEIDDKIGIVLNHVEGCFYEILLGNKKVLIAKV